MRESFSDNLRYALKHLYAPNILRSSPLIGMLQIQGRSNVALALRERLVQEIELLKPGADIPTHTHLWRAYEILLYRYVQQCSQKEVSDQLRISVRHLRREQHEAIEVLAQRLWAEMDLPANDSAPEMQCAEGEQQQPASLSDELGWLRYPPPEEPITLSMELSTILGLVQPLASKHHVVVRATPFSPLPPLAVHPVALRQILLSVLGAAIREPRTGKVIIDSKTTQWGIEMMIHATRRMGCVSEFPSRPEEAVQSKDGIEIARQLSSACGGTLVRSHQGEGFFATITLPTAGQVAVLIIDDHADTLRLLQRYVGGTRYHVVACNEPDAVFDLVREHSPKLVTLDVMMPQMDGWELLGRLRQHPLSSHIPVIVCTILPEKELALSLGASGFLEKPVSREAFIHALDQHLAPRELESH